MAGDIQAIKEVIDRTEGKPTQAVELSGQEGRPISLTRDMAAGVAARWRLRRECPSARPPFAAPRE
jgi:hypothetical protein